MNTTYVKSTAILFLSTLMMVGFSSCSNNTLTNETTQNEKVNENGTQKQSLDVPKNIESMLEPADAILMCKVEGKFSYIPKDPTFFWTALYDFTGLYGAEHSLSKVTDTELIMPKQAVQEYALKKDISKFLKYPFYSYINHCLLPQTQPQPVNLYQMYIHHSYIFPLLCLKPLLCYRLQ
jgi:hypothetical protein